MPKEQKRLVFLMSILLILLAGYLLRGPIFQKAHKPKQLVAGKNSINSMKIITEADGELSAEITYFYNGLPAYSYMNVIIQRGDEENESPYGSYIKLNLGLNTVKAPIHRPYIPTEAYTSKKVVAKFMFNKEFPSPRISQDYNINWPDFYTYNTQREERKLTIQDFYNRAVSLIDSEDIDSLPTARRYLEKILIKDPKFVDAYYQLARIATRENESKQGFEEGVSYMKIALGIDPLNTSALIELGHLYTNLNKLSEAENEFDKAEKIGTSDLWLWTERGDLWMKKNDLVKALNMYLKAIDGAQSDNSYDRARLAAYERAINIYIARSEFDKAENLYTKVESDYGNKNCYYTQHAQFQLISLENFLKAIDLAKQSISKGCSSQYGRKILGLAYYKAWSSSKGDQKLEYEGLAKTFYPVSPELYIELAQKNTLTPILKALTDGGNNIDLKSDNNINALAISFMNDDIETAKKLLKAGAKVSVLVGPQNYPVAFIPILNRSESGLKLVLSGPIDITELKANGMTALEIAKKYSNTEIIRLLEVKSQTKT